MKIEQQVVSLELAKKLKELGVKQESAFYFRRHIESDVVFGPQYTKGFPLKDSRNGYIAAFTVAELGEMLPGSIECGFKQGQARMVLVIGKVLDIDYMVSYRNVKLSPPIIVTDQTEANARAKMLIHLIEQGIVNP